VTKPNCLQFSQASACYVIKPAEHGRLTVMRFVVLKTSKQQARAGV
jgi:hypothetical protein